MQVHQELVADLLTSGHVPHALRFLHDTIGLGRPYMGHFRYHGTLGALSFLDISVHRGRYTLMKRSSYYDYI